MENPANQTTNSVYTARQKVSQMQSQDNQLRAAIAKWESVRQELLKLAESRQNHLR